MHGVERIRAQALRARETPAGIGLNVLKAAGGLVFASRLARCSSGEASSQKPRDTVGEIRFRRPERLMHDLKVGGGRGNFLFLSGFASRSWLISRTSICSHRARLFRQQYP